MRFNIIGVVAIIGFFPIITQILEKLIPKTDADLQRQQRQREKHEANTRNKEAQPSIR
jgi:hypothetical protein